MNKENYVSLQHEVQTVDNKDHLQKLRLLYVAKLLYEETDAEHYLTTNQLRSALLERWGIESHRQTIPSDIAALRALGVDIKEYLGTQKRFWIEDRTFTVPEVKLLMDAVNAAKFIPKVQSVELEQKLLKMVSSFEAEGLVRNVSVEHRVKRDNKHIYDSIDVLNDAINQKQKVTFQYFRYNVRKRPVLRHDGELYVISPHQLVWNGDYYYLIGVNEFREVRIFRIDRIKDSPRILDEKALPLPKGFSMSKFLNTSFRMFGTDYQRVSLICENDVVDSILDRFGRSTDLQIVDKGHFRISVDVAVNNVFFGWIFGFSGKVRIEGPEEVRGKYREMVESAIKV